MQSVLISQRYCGPALSGNGGYVAGTLASYVDTAGAIQVSLRQPPPLDLELNVETDADGARLTFGGAVIAAAAVDDSDLTSIPSVEFETAMAASASYPGLTFHPFPTCYACGTGREDGLRIFPGRVDDVDGRVTVAAPWTPAETERSEPGSATTSVGTAWASLDCVGGWAGDLTERLMVLGRMTAHLDALPRIGEPHVVMGQALGQDGRKTFTATTLYDADGRVVGRAEHVWIAVDPDAFNLAPPSGDR